jgi:hypothetical protein
VILSIFGAFLIGGVGYYFYAQGAAKAAEVEFGVAGINGVAPGGSVAAAVPPVA